jgi:hypothetical protein
MPSTNRSRVKGRRESASFTALPHNIFRSTPDRPAPVAMLSKPALALLVDLCQQFDGSNNGNFSAAPKTLAAYGWRSRGAVADALVELVALGFLVQTRQGGRNRCSLYAMTWRGMDEGPHDASPNPVPSNLWRAEHAHLRDPAFVRRWESRRHGHGQNASRHSDKCSRHSDKSAHLRLAK